MSHSGEDLRPPIEVLVRRIRALEDNELIAVAGGVEPATVAALPAAGDTARLRFATDGRKSGEGPAAGTGVLVYDDGTAWRRVDDGTTVLA